MHIAAFLHRKTPIKNTGMLAGIARHFFRRLEHLRFGVVAKNAGMPCITRVFS